MIAAAQISSCGGRTENEDSVKLMQRGQTMCVVVADGLGGHGGGKIASDTAAEVVISNFKKNRLESKNQILQAIHDADSHVKEKQTKNCEMKTTIVVLLIEEKIAKWAHVGDSRLYHFKDTRLMEQTLDHSVSQMAVLMNEITKEQIRFHEDRNRVLRALGSENCEPDMVDGVSLAEGFHAFLLCTDGFWEYVYEDEMESLLSQSASPEEWLDGMEALVKKRAQEKHDNYTAAAVFVI